MAWTTPRDWTGISDDIVTAAQLNVDIRDNLTVLSTHSHTGAAGQGASSMSGVTLAALTTLTFADQSANPDAAGELQRNGNYLLWYGSSVVNLTAADASAGTASLRSLGTTSVKAAAGNHTHTPASEAVGQNEDVATITGSEVTVATVTATPGATLRSWVIWGAIHPVSTTNTYTLKLYFDATALETITGVTGGGAANTIKDLVGFQAGVAVSAHTVKVTAQRTAGSGDVNAYGIVGFREVSG